MTKRELINLLESLDVPDDTPVITPVTVDDAAFDDVNQPVIVSAKLNTVTGYCGNHSIQGDGYWKDFSKVHTRQCIAISFYDPSFFTDED
ncbi:hypothetical protein Lepto7375DRAFT_7233 [Leptolyngbya sp. PCC 7375]|nr:hypothetical protein Lepto7375DRAFT_7233 [Leptolyngbya sp. PCC 7375]